MSKPNPGAEKIDHLEPDSVPGCAGEPWRGQALAPLQVLVRNESGWRVIAVNLAYAQNWRCWGGRA